LGALRTAAWNKREAARMLRISYKALFNKLNSLGIGREEQSQKSVISEQ